MDNRIKPIEVLIEEGLSAHFGRVFGFPLLITNSSNGRELVKRQNKEQTPSYPFAFANVSSVSLAQQQAGYRATSTLRRGFAGQATWDQVGTYKFSGIPAETGYAITVVSNSFADLRTFAKRWLFSAVSGRLKYEVLYGVVNVGIHLILDTNVTFNTRDASPTAVEEHELQVNLIVNGWLSEDLLLKEQAAISVELDGVLVQQERDRALMQTDSPGDVQVFSIKREWPAGDGPLTK